MTGWKRGTRVFIPPASTPRMGKNVELQHPTNQTCVYGHFPEIALPSLQLPAGDIVLRYGEQMSQHRGFGFMHIWQDHYTHIADQDSAQVAICADVASIVRPGVPIFHEIGSKAMLFRASVGVVIVQLTYRADNTPIYSVVSCYDGTKTHGPHVGAVV